MDLADASFDVRSENNVSEYLAAIVPFERGGKVA
jgi:hypothetical protein